MKPLNPGCANLIFVCSIHPAFPTDTHGPRGESLGMGGGPAPPCFFWVGVGGRGLLFFKYGANTGVRAFPPPEKTYHQKMAPSKIKGEKKKYPLAFPPKPPPHGVRAGGGGGFFFGARPLSRREGGAGLGGGIFFFFLKNPGAQTGVPFF